MEVLFCFFVLMRHLEVDVVLYSIVFDIGFIWVRIIRGRRCCRGGGCFGLMGPGHVRGPLLRLSRYSLHAVCLM